MVRPMTERMSVVGVFSNLRDAQAAVRDLKAAGFTDHEIGVLGPGDHAGQGAHGTGSADGGTHAAEGAAAGAATGAGIGALWAVGIAAGLLPAIGPVIAGGILASIAASAVGGAAVASLAGALIGLGIPEDEANYYENEFKSGRTVVTVKTATRQDEARRILGRHSGYDMESRPDRAGSRSTGSTVAGSTGSTGSTIAGSTIAGATTADVGLTGGTHAAAGRTAAYDRTAAPVARATEGETVQLREEQLRAEKVQKQAGEVRVHKEVITEHKTVEVPVTREEVVIERRPVHGTQPAGTIAGGIAPGEEIRIPVKEEQVNVSKTAVVKEEVSVGKRKVTETQRVAADVKHEELRVDETGDVNVKGPGASDGRTRKGR